MKIYIVYDSYFGNTKLIAEKLEETFQVEHEVVISHVDHSKIDTYYDLLIVGTPTRGFSATPIIMDFLKTVDYNYIKYIAIFDTRIDSKDIKQKFVRFLMKKFGYGIDKIEKYFKKQKLGLLISKNSFNVLESEGPLDHSQLEKAEKWCQEIITIMK